MAVHYFVLYYKHYLYGNQFLIRTDHKALTWLLNWHNPNTSQYCRRQTDIEIFQIDINYIERIYIVENIITFDEDRISLVNQDKLKINSLILT